MVAGVRDAAEPDGGNAGLCIRPVIAGVVRAGPGGDFGSARRCPYGIPEPGAAVGGSADRHITGAYADPIE
jgi:hypothetical protein